MRGRGRGAKSVGKVRTEWYEPEILNALYRCILDRICGCDSSIERIRNICERL